MTDEPTCRIRRKELGLPYPQSSCFKCGSLLSANWRCAEGRFDELPRIPASEAPEGKWCIAYVKVDADLCECAADHFPAMNIALTDDTKQAIKIGGEWWQWQLKDGGRSLERYRGRWGRIWSGDDDRYASTEWSFEPHEVIVIPDDVMRAGKSP